MYVECRECGREFPEYMFANTQGRLGTCLDCYYGKDKIEVIRKRPQLEEDENYGKEGI